MWTLLVKLVLLLALLAGMLLLAEAAKEEGTSANTTLQAQPGEHHVQKVSHTQWLDILVSLNFHWALVQYCNLSYVHALLSPLYRLSH